MTKWPLPESTLGRPSRERPSGRTLRSRRAALASFGHTLHVQVTPTRSAAASATLLGSVWRLPRSALKIGSCRNGSVWRLPCSAPKNGRVWRLPSSALEIGSLQLGSAHPLECSERTSGTKPTLPKSLSRRVGSSCCQSGPRRGGPRRSRVTESSFRKALDWALCRGHRRLPLGSSNSAKLTVRTLTPLGSSLLRELGRQPTDTARLEQTARP